MSLKPNTHIKELLAPKQRILYTEPITEVITHKKRNYKPIKMPLYS